MGKLYAEIILSDSYLSVGKILRPKGIVLIRRLLCVSSNTRSVNWNHIPSKAESSTLRDVWIYHQYSQKQGGR